MADPMDALRAAVKAYDDPRVINTTDVIKRLADAARTVVSAPASPPGLVASVRRPPSTQQVVTRAMETSAVRDLRSALRGDPEAASRVMEDLTRAGHR